MNLMPQTRCETSLLSYSKTVDLTHSVYYNNENLVTKILSSNFDIFVHTERFCAFVEGSSVKKDLFIHICS